MLSGFKHENVCRLTAVKQTSHRCCNSNSRVSDSHSDIYPSTANVKGLAIVPPQTPPLQQQRQCRNIPLNLTRGLYRLSTMFWLKCNGHNNSRFTLAHAPVLFLTERTSYLVPRCYPLTTTITAVTLTLHITCPVIPKKL